MSAMSVEMILRLVDAATGPLRKVLGEVEQLEKATGRLNATGGAGGGGVPAWVAQQRQVQDLNKQIDAYEGNLRRVREMQLGAGEAAASAALVHGVNRFVHKGIGAGADAAHAEVSLETQGNTLDQIIEIESAAAELSRRFRAFSKTQVETMLGDAKTYVGSLEHAIAAMPELLKLRAIQQGMRGTSSDQEFGHLAKALEQGGVTTDPQKLRERVDTFARWLEVYRETFSVGDINEFYRGLKGPIARSLSEDFLRGTAGHFIQQMGGFSTGNALTQLYQAVVAGRMLPRAAEAFGELGLIDESKVRRYRSGVMAGIPRFIEPGAVTGGQLFRTDPDKWIEQVLGPALSKFSGEKREELEAALFSDQTARNIADKILNQSGIIAKDRAFIGQAPGLPAWETWRDKDPRLAGQSVASQAENLLRDATKPLMPAATRLMNWSSELLAVADRFNSAHPAAAIGEALAALGGMAWGSVALWKSAMMHMGAWWGRGAATAPAVDPAATAEYQAMVEAFAKSKGALPKDLASKLLQGDAAAQARLIEDAEALGKGGGGAGVAAGLARNVPKMLGHGLALGVLDMAGHAALDAIEEHLLGWTPESKARAETAVTAKAHEWWRSHGISLPWWEAAPQRVPTMADQAAAPPQPQADTAQIDAVKDKAAAAGQEIRTALDVTIAPRVDASSIDALLAKLQQAKSLLGSLGIETDRIAWQIGRGTRPGTGVLHDGYEAH